MTALATAKNVPQMGQDPIPSYFDFPVKGGVKCYPGAGLVVQGGYALPAKTALGLISLGRGDTLADNTNGADGAITVRAKVGVFPFKNSAGADAIAAKHVMSAVAYWVDDQTVALTDGGGTRSVAGPIMGLDATLGVYVGLAYSPATIAATEGNAAASPAGKARAVITTLGAYGGSGTSTLLASANGALAAADGVTVANGDVVFVPPGITNVTAKDSGPWIATSIGGASAKVQLDRPSWWANGEPVVQSATVEISGEGTAFRGAVFKSMCAKGKVIGTDDPHFYPSRQLFRITLASGTYTIGAGGGGENLFLLDTTLTAVGLSQDTHAGTLGTERLEAPSASRIAGYPGTAAIVVNSLVDAGTVAGSDSSTVDVVVTNF